MNHLTALKPLKNTYFAMRHGTSLANEEGIILSDPAQGIPGYGLSETGHAEVRAAAEKAKHEGVLDVNTIIVASDFRRTRETAEILADVLGVDMVTTTPKLRERFFGSWEGTSNTHYKDVWVADAHDGTHTNGDVESVAHLLDRTTALVTELEERYQDARIVLVSHGDTLHVLQTAFEALTPGEHRTLTPLSTAEIRVLTPHA